MGSSYPTAIDPIPVQTQANQQLLNGYSAAVAVEQYVGVTGATDTYTITGQIYNLKQGGGGPTGATGATGAGSTGGQGISVSGGAVGLNGTESVNVVASSAGTTQTLAAVATSIGNDITLQSGDNLTVTMPSAARGAFCYCFIRQPGSGTTTNTVTFTSVKWPSATPPTASTGASAISLFQFISDGTNWYGVTSGLAFG